MTGEDLFIAVLVAFPSFMLWATIHELSHLVTVHFTSGVSSYELHLLPHFHKGHFYWARIHYVPTFPMVSADRGLVALAPRIPDLVSALMLPLLAPLDLWIAILVGGGVVDLITGSIGWSDRSDLMEASDAYRVNPWILRAGGFLIAAASIAVYLWRTV